ncbi:hypothetical protein [Kosakonia oryzendophytica]|uniref:hypothetical protein n=1 Tax=Kosakonia oryzendophytica TaxID=1005665 RepID=UPI000A7515E2|nr:hypothetical protein [Kosakonia oryzendophytica]WBT59174.1 hypothetical protein O9K67_05100 [Kosakonia oryzendophytica]
MLTRLIPLTLLAMATTATATPLPESLLRCDSQFFSELYAQRATLTHTAPLKTDNQGHAWFVAPKEGGRCGVVYAAAQGAATDHFRLLHAYQRR